MEEEAGSLHYAEMIGNCLTFTIVPNSPFIQIISTVESIDRNCKSKLTGVGDIQIFPTCVCDGGRPLLP